MRSMVNIFVVLSFLVVCLLDASRHAVEENRINLLHVDAAESQNVGAEPGDDMTLDEIMEGARASEERSNAALGNVTLDQIMEGARLSEEDILTDILGTATVRFNKNQAMATISKFGQLADCLGVDRNIFIQARLLHAVPRDSFRDAEGMGKLTDVIWDQVHHSVSRAKEAATLRGATNLAYEAKEAGATAYMAQQTATAVATIAGTVASGIAGEVVGGISDIDRAFADQNGKLALKLAVQHSVSLLFTFLAANAAGTAVVALVSLATGGLGTIPALIVYAAGNFAITYAAKAGAGTVTEKSWDLACKAIYQDLQAKQQ